MYASPKQQKYENYRLSAQRRGITWKLSPQDFIDLWGKKCVFCHTPIETIGITRVDPYIGYYPFNVDPCCITCNRQKSAKSRKEYVAWRKAKGLPCYA